MNYNINNLLFNHKGKRYVIDIGLVYSALSALYFKYVFLKTMLIKKFILQVIKQDTDFYNEKKKKKEIKIFRKEKNRNCI